MRKVDSASYDSFSVISVEFDASARAKVLLPELGIIRGPEESRAVSRVLNAAALTYVAAAAASVLQLAYWVLQLLAVQQRREE